MAEKKQTGFKIDSTGNAEFNSVTLRGCIEAESRNNPWAKGSVNLTMQAEILKADPKLAAKLKAQAAAAEQAEAAKRSGAGQGSAKLPEKVAVLTGRKPCRPRRCLP